MTDGYRVLFAASARRHVNGPPEKTAAAVIEFCFGPLADDPHRLGNPLMRDLAGHHSARRGQYRIVYRIDDDARLVLVVRVEHRGDAYRPR